MGDRDSQFAAAAAPPYIRLAPGVRLSGAGEGRLGVVLALGNGQVQLNRMAADILSLCDGSRDAEAIVSRIVAVTVTPVLGSDVRDFLRAALARGWIICGG